MAPQSGRNREFGTYEAGQPGDTYEIEFAQ